MAGQRRLFSVMPAFAGMTLILMFVAFATPVSAEPEVLRGRFEILGRFAGYVVSCGVASEDDASEMVKTLGAGLGEWSKSDTAAFDAARAAARKSDCSDGSLRDAIERGWLNYKEAK